MMEGDSCCAIDKLMEECDTDGDGKISYGEFIQAGINHKALLNQENIKAVFNILDENGDGQITLNELNNAMGGAEI